MAVINDNIESIEQILISTGELKIKLLVNFYKKRKDDNTRVSNIYANSYLTKKYNHEKDVKKLIIDTKTFLVFSYNNENSNSNVFLTYSNLNELKNVFRFFEEEFNNIGKNKNSVFYYDENKNLKLNKRLDFSYRIIGSSEKLLGFSPTIVRDKLTNNIYPILKLYIENDSNIVLLENWSILTISELLRNFNMLIASQNLIIISKLYEEDFTSLQKRDI